jgi:hypothetical protein
MPYTVQHNKHKLVSSTPFSYISNIQQTSMPNNAGQKFSFGASVVCCISHLSIFRAHRLIPVTDWKLRRRDTTPPYAAPSCVTVAGVAYHLLVNDARGGRGLRVCGVVRSGTARWNWRVEQVYFSTMANPVALPQKKYYRQRAHSNPIADHCIE